jgi:beta-phosphoglucomutase
VPRHVALSWYLPYEAIFFDFDGVILDTEPEHYACWLEVLSPFGVPFEWDTYKQQYIGVADRIMIRDVCERACPPADFDAVMREHPRKKVLFRERMVRKAKLRDDVRELITDLKQRFNIAIVTSSGKIEIEPILDALGILDQFGTIVYGGDVKQLKPAPDPYLLAAERLGVRRALVVEDSDAGVASGKAAGFDVVRVERQSDMVTLVRTALGC